MLHWDFLQKHNQYTCSHKPFCTRHPSCHKLAFHNMDHNKGVACMGPGNTGPTHNLQSIPYNKSLAVDRPAAGPLGPVQEA
uniref:Uncharacterized protein n=1 Tax=Rhizophora mucronata TaxID=61149 RepID=A0A2P2MPJ8_RHIMU